MNNATLTSPLPASPALPAANEPLTTARVLRLLAAVMLPMMLASLDQTLLAAASPAVGREFDALASTPWLALGYLVASASMIPVYGQLGDRHGYRRLLLGALWVFGAGSLLGALAPNMPLLVAARVVQGLGGGGLMVMSQALIGEVVPPRERPRFQGWFAGVFTLSSLAGPVLGGLGVHALGWRSLFYGLLPLVALALWRVSRLPRTLPPARDAAPLDKTGIAGFALAMSLSLAWVTFVGQQFSVVSALGLGGLAAAGVAWVLLLRAERRCADPLLPLELFALPGMRWVAGGVAAMAATLFALVFYLPMYVQYAGGGTAAASGAALLPLMLGIAAGSTISGRITAKLGHTSRLPSAGLLLAAAAVAALALLPSTTLLRTLACAACGLGLGTVMPQSQVIVQTLAGRPRLGAASALVSISRSLGSMLGTGVFGALLFGQIDAHAPAAAWRQAFHWLFGGVVLILVAGAASSWRAPQVDLREGA